MWGHRLTHRLGRTGKCRTRYFGIFFTETDKQNILHALMSARSVWISRLFLIVLWGHSSHVCLFRCSAIGCTCHYMFRWDTMLCKTVRPLNTWVSCSVTGVWKGPCWPPLWPEDAQAPRSHSYSGLRDNWFHPFHLWHPQADWWQSKPLTQSCSICSCHNSGWWLAENCQIGQLITPLHLVSVTAKITVAQWKLWVY